MPLRDRSTLVRAVLLLLALWGTHSNARSAQTDFWTRADIAPYRALVEAYRDGRTLEAMNGLLTLGPKQVRSVVDELRDRDTRRSGAGENPNANQRLFRLAVMLHTDAAEELWSAGRHEDASFQVDVARRWADLTDRPPARPEPFRRQWYLAAGYLVFERAGWEAALEFFERACQALPDDVPLLTTTGWLNEQVALAPVSPDSALSESIVAMARREKRAGLNEAARRFAAALAADPSASEAALRLARVRTLLGAAAEARGLLTDLVGRSELAPPHAYLARLLLGQLHEQSGEAIKAAALYRDAATRVPNGQSARMALSQLLHASGERRWAADAIEPVVAGDRGGVIDPWAEYVLGTQPGPGLREALRAEVRQ